MARLRVGQGFFANFDTTPLATASGPILVADDHLIRIDAKDGIENFIGRFHYNTEGLPLGTIDTYRLVSGKETLYAISPPTSMCWNCGIPLPPATRRISSS